MLRLITLGRIELTDARGQPVESILKRPKNLALLAYLAAAGAGSTRSRDTVLGLFWPELPQAKARQALNQALYFLRKELGRDVVVSVGNEIGVAAGALWCDAAAVRSAAASGDQRSAQAHYRGEFLPGFYLGDAPDFEKWLDTERDALQRLVSSSAWKLAEEAAAAGDVETAAAAAVRSAELSLREEAAVRRAIELLDRLGERARALDLYRELEAELEEDFGTRPAPETQAVVARIRAREPEPEVARALERAEPVAASAAHDSARWRWQAEGPEAQPAPLITGPGNRARVMLALPLIGVALLVGLVWMLTRESDAVLGSTATDPHVLIEPFDAYAGDQLLSDIASSVTAGLAEELAEVKSIEVLLVQRGSHPTAESAAIAVATPDTGARAFFIVKGRVEREGDVMKAAVSLSDRRTGRVIATTRVRRATNDPILFAEAVARDAAAFARAAVGRELRERAWRASTRDREAWQLLERAESYRRDADTLAEDEAFDAAEAALTHADSLLALAEARAEDWTPPITLRAHLEYDRMWTALSQEEPAGVSQAVNRGLAHAERALRIDPADARAHEVRGLLLYWQVQHGAIGTDSAVVLMAEIERTLRRAVEIERMLPDAWRTLSAVLLRQGRYQEALYAAQSAYEADAFLDRPHDILAKLFETAFEAHNDPEARRWCREMLERYPFGGSGLMCSLTVLAWLETPGDSAVLSARNVIVDAALPPGHELTPFIDLQYALVLARAGESGSARSILDRLSGANPETPPYEASVHLALGNIDSAAALMERYINEQPVPRRGLLQSRRFVELNEWLSRRTPEHR